VAAAGGGALRNSSLTLLLSVGALGLGLLESCCSDCDCAEDTGGNATDGSGGNGGLTGQSGIPAGGDGAADIDLLPGCWEGYKECDPRDPSSCGTNGETCDYGENQITDGLFCFDPPNILMLGDTCDSTDPDGPFCGPGLHCPGAPGKCARMCCEDAECQRDEYCDSFVPHELWTLGTCQPVQTGGASGAGAGGASGEAGAAGGGTAGQAGGPAGATGLAGGSSAGSAGAAGAAGMGGASAGAAGGGFAGEPAAGGGGGAAGQGGSRPGVAGTAGLPQGGMAGAGGSAGNAGVSSEAGAGAVGGDAGSSGSAGLVTEAGRAGSAGAAGSGV
jgi:hypothetical protein